MTPFDAPTFFIASASFLPLGSLPHRSSCDILIERVVSDTCTKSGSPGARPGAVPSNLEATCGAAVEPAAAPASDRRTRFQPLRRGNTMLGERGRASRCRRGGGVGVRTPFRFGTAGGGGGRSGSCCRCSGGNEGCDGPRPCRRWKPTSSRSGARLRSTAAEAAAASALAARFCAEECFRPAR